jgi:DNA methylase
VTTPVLPERVDTSNIVALRDLADATVEWAREADDAGALWEATRRAGALERYVDDVETEKRLRRARGWTMAHLGRVLGDGPGQGHGLTAPSKRSPSSGSVPVPDQRISEARRLREWALDRPDPEVIKALDAGDPIFKVLRLIAERTPIETGIGDVLEGERWRIVTGDFREMLQSLPERSIDLIITDPPYPTEYLPLYSDLAEVAAWLLQPRGLLFVLTGQINLPAVMELLGDYMTYGWTFCHDLPGTNSRIMGRHLIQTWKPVLAYSTGTWPAGEWRLDRVIGDGPDQTRFAWGQSVAPAQDLIESYTRPDALVLDPFVGGGAYGVATLRAGRRFLGIERVPSKAADAARRLAEVP